MHLAQFGDYDILHGRKARGFSPVSRDLDIDIAYTSYINGFLLTYLIILAKQPYIYVILNNCGAYMTATHR